MDIPDDLECSSEHEASESLQEATTALANIVGNPIYRSLLSEQTSKNYSQSIWDHDPTCPELENIDGSISSNSYDCSHCARGIFRPFHLEKFQNIMDEVKLQNTMHEDEVSGPKESLGTKTHDRINIDIRNSNENFPTKTFESAKFFFVPPGASLTHTEFVQALTSTHTIAKTRQHKQSFSIWAKGTGCLSRSLEEAYSLVESLFSIVKVYAKTVTPRMNIDLSTPQKTTSNSQSTPPTLPQTRKRRVDFISTSISEKSRASFVLKSNCRSRRKETKQIRERYFQKLRQVHGEKRFEVALVSDMNLR